MRGPWQAGRERDVAGWAQARHDEVGEGRGTNPLSRSLHALVWRAAGPCPSCLATISTGLVSRRKTVRPSGFFPLRPRADLFSWHGGNLIRGFRSCVKFGVLGRRWFCSQACNSLQIV